jgi:tetratricopeptide (TPR) repeat protein
MRLRDRTHCRLRSLKAPRRAVQLDPNLADGYLVLASVQGVRGELLRCFEVIQSKVFVLDPDNADALNAHALGLANSGGLKEALAPRLHVLELEPAVQNLMIRTAMLKDLPADRTAAAALIDASMGRFQDALVVLQKLSPAAYPPETVHNAVLLLCHAPGELAALQTLPRLGILGWVYFYAGAPDRVLDIYDRGIDAGSLARAGNPEIV